MTIKKRLLMSNIAMIVIPVMSFFILEIVLGYVLFFVQQGGTDGSRVEDFIFLRFIGLVIVLVVTNGLLTYFVAKSIINPIRKLSLASKEIAEGNLNFSVDVKGKDEISQLAASFETMRQKLKETEELNERYEANRRELIANISHDLKTPITSIKGYVNGIRDGVANTEEKMDKYMDTIATKANELDQLIDELFMYSKLNLNKVPFRFEPIDLQAYLSDYLEELRFDVEERGGIVRFHVEDKLDYLVKADREKLNRVLTNIIEDSIKYMDKEKQEIGVFLSSEGNYVKVQIQDNGSGISADSIAHIFDQFYRTDQSRNSSTGGSGIGLAIVKQIIEAHGGTVWAESEQGTGTTISFTLPKVGEKA